MNHEVEWLHKNGTVKTMLLNSNLYSKEGRFCHTRCFLRDVTELKAASYTLGAQRQKIEDAEKNRQIQKEFVDTVCHEIRSPLHGILGSVYLLQEQLATLQNNIQNNVDPSACINELKNLTDSIKECGQHQQVILDDVLDLSKLETSGVQLYRTAFDPREAVNSVSRMLRGDMNKNVQLKTEFLGNPKQVVTDENRFKQVLINLVSNAIKFTEHGEITISLEHLSKDFLLVTVSDTGPGMTDNEMESLFQKFSQVGQKKRHQRSGSGLGLWISKQIVTLLGGTFKVESTKGQGSKFSFSVKCDAIDETFNQQLQSERADTPVESKPKETRALIVEDNAVNSKVLGHFLRQKGVDYDIVESGEEALNRLDRMTQDYCPYSMVFMDIHMNGISGIEAAQKIRKREEELGCIDRVTIVCVSGYTRDDYKSMAKRAGMDEYICKPFKKADIYMIIDKWFI
jgi:signal transduction histidine kinase/CheY-like chemotaxis protein